MANTKSLSISVVKGKGHIRHNNRTILAKNVDKSRVKLNKYYVQESLEDAYRKCFQDALDEYNGKQTRSDRKIDDYIQHIKNSKNGEKPFYEIVVQVGNKQTCGRATKNFDEAGKMLDEYMERFLKENPNLYVFNAVLHMDERTPHLHIDYIPLAHGYKNGLKVRNSLDKALKEQGVDGKANKFQNRTQAWQEKQKSTLETIMREHGFEREPERGLHREHMTVNQYKAVAEQIKNEVSRLPKQIETAPMLFNKERVTVSKVDLTLLEKRADLSTVYERHTKELERMIDKDYRDLSDYTLQQMSLATRYAALAQGEYQKANEMQEKYADAYQKQLTLNEKYEELRDVCVKQEQTIKELQTENRSLREQVLQLKDTFREQLERVTAPFKEKIAKLENSVERLCNNLKNVTKAFNMLQYDQQQGYMVTTDKKQARLFEAVENYVKGALRRENREDMALDVEKNIGISEGIEEEIDALKPKERSRGFELER